MQESIRGRNALHMSQHLVSDSCGPLKLLLELGDELVQTEKLGDALVQVLRLDRADSLRINCPK